MRKIILLFLLLIFISQASAYDKTFYEGNKTLIIQQSGTGKVLFTVQQVSVSSGLTLFEEVFNITSYLASDYTFSVSDVEFRWKQYKGNNNITNMDFFLFKQSNYSIVVDDYGLNSTWRSKEVYNNETGLNDIVWYWDNKTVVVGNHSEIIDNSTWLKLNNLNDKIIKSGESYIIKIVFTKKFEKEFSIKFTPSFMGVSEDKMTWWNASYPNATFSQVTNPNLTTIYLNLHNVTGINNGTDVFGSFIFNTTTNTMNSTHFVVDNTTEIPFYTNNISGNTANVSINVSTVNSTNYIGLYSNGQTDYGSVSNLTKTFINGSDGETGNSLINDGKPVTINSTYKYTGNNSIRMDNADGADHNGSYLTLPNLSGSFVVDYWVLAAQTDKALGIVTTKDAYSNGGAGLYVEAPGTNGGNNFNAYDTQFRLLYSGYNALQWYHIKYVVKSTNAVDIYVDNMVTPVYTNLPPRQALSDWNRLYIVGYETAVAGGVAYWDNIIVYNLTSPMPTWAGWGGWGTEAIREIISVIIL